MLLVDLLYNNGGQAMRMANNEYHAIKFLKISRASRAHPFF